MQTVGARHTKEENWSCISFIYHDCTPIWSKSTSVQASKHFHCRGAMSCVLKEMYWRGGWTPIALCGSLLLSLFTFLPCQHHARGVYGCYDSIKLSFRVAIKYEQLNRNMHLVRCFLFGCVSRAIQPFGPANEPSDRMAHCWGMRNTRTKFLLTSPTAASSWRDPIQSWPLNWFNLAS